MTDTHQTSQPETRFTVYGQSGSRGFTDVWMAHEWALAELDEHGGEYECRDENFDHVFTVEA